MTDKRITLVNNQFNRTCFYYPVISVLPYVVLKPTIPQSADGILTEPVVGKRYQSETDKNL